MHASTIPGVDLPLPFFPFPFDVWNAPWHRLGISAGTFFRPATQPPADVLEEDRFFFSPTPSLPDDSLDYSTTFSCWSGFCRVFYFSPCPFSSSFPALLLLLLLLLLRFFGVGLRLFFFPLSALSAAVVDFDGEGSTSPAAPKEPDTPTRSPPVPLYWGQVDDRRTTGGRSSAWSVTISPVPVVHIILRRTFEFFTSTIFEHVTHIFYLRLIMRAKNANRVSHVVEHSFQYKWPKLWMSYLVILIYR